MQLAGVVRSSIQRAYKTGSISAKMVVPFAQTLQVPPTYLTGETDEAEGFEDDQLKVFLEKLGYKGIRVKQKRGRKPGSRNAATVEKETVAVSEQSAPTSAPLSDEAQSFIDTVDDETLVLLMRAMLVREKTGGRNAALAKELKLLLFEINQG